MKHDAQAQRRSVDDLVLYHFPSCPFCQRVQRTLAELGLQIELRDIRAFPAYRDQLERATGDDMVPVLRIAGADGSVTWMPESLDIVRYLERCFGPPGHDAG